uniref:Uncharacterized protein n=1 Tax=Cacopsylla melanoneura TaxID=428564 RepID=A0A8D8XF90_9HEMI
MSLIRFVFFLNKKCIHFIFRTFQLTREIPLWTVSVFCSRNFGVYRNKSQIYCNILVYLGGAILMGKILACVFIFRIKPGYFPGKRKKYLDRQNRSISIEKNKDLNKYLPCYQLHCFGFKFVYQIFVDMIHHFTCIFLVGNFCCIFFWTVLPTSPQYPIYIYLPDGYLAHH